MAEKKKNNSVAIIASQTSQNFRGFFFENRGIFAISEKTDLGRVGSADVALKYRLLKMLGANSVIPILLQN